MTSSIPTNNQIIIIKGSTLQPPSFPREVRHTPHTSSDGSQSTQYSASSADKSVLPYPLCPHSPPPPLHVTQHLHRVIKASRRFHLLIARLAMNRAFSGRVVHNQHAIHIRMEVRTSRQCPHSPDLPLKSQNNRGTRSNGATSTSRSWPDERSRSW